MSGTNTQDDAIQSETPILDGIRRAVLSDEVVRIAIILPSMAYAHNAFDVIASHCTWENRRPIISPSMYLIEWGRMVSVQICSSSLPEATYGHMYDLIFAYKIRLWTNLAMFRRLDELKRPGRVVIYCHDDEL